MNGLKVVYILTNPAMPGLVKIGYSSQDEATKRIAQLYTTGVPVPFRLEFACKVPNPDEVEKALHIAFAPHRINPRREFFKMEADQAIAILKLLHVEEATEELERQPDEIDSQSIEAGIQLRSRRPNLNFMEMGIPIGAVLHSVHDDATVIVVSTNKVRLGDEEMSLTAATRQIMSLDYSVAPAPHWTYNGRLLSDLYEETHGDTN
jgi:hypothetical protein